MARGEVLETWEKLAAVVQNARFAHGLTRAELTELADVSESQLVAIESGQPVDDHEAIRRVLATLDVIPVVLPFPIDDDAAAERARAWELVKRVQELDPPMGRYLRSRPASRDGIRALVVLDVDGVINRLPGIYGEQRERTQLATGPGGLKFYLDVDLEIAQALDEQVRRPGVALAWLTTWGRDVDNLIHGVLDGKYLTTGFVLAERAASKYVAGTWKMDALVSFLEELGDPATPFVWADDDAVAWAQDIRDFGNAVIGREPRLLFNPFSHVGLTMDDVVTIAEFIDEHTHG